VFLTQSRPVLPELLRRARAAGVQFRRRCRALAEFAALLIGLSLYTAAFIAEIVRAGVMAVRRDQWHAAQALGLERRHVLRYVVAPQALRVIVPPLNQPVPESDQEQLARGGDRLPRPGSRSPTPPSIRPGRRSRASPSSWRSISPSASPSGADELDQRAAAMKRIPNSPSPRRDPLPGMEVRRLGFRARRMAGPIASACRAATGACWGFIVEKHRLIAFRHLSVRGALAARACLDILVALWALSVVRHFWKPRLILIWAAGLLVIGVLMWGGVFGLPYVENERWGGLILTLLLTTFGWRSRSLCRFFLHWEEGPSSP